MTVLPAKIKWHRVRGQMYGIYVVIPSVLRVPVKFPPAGARLIVGASPRAGDDPPLLVVVLQPVLPEALRLVEKPALQLLGREIIWLPYRLSASRDFGEDMRLYLKKTILRRVELTQTPKLGRVEIPVEFIHGKLGGRPADIIRIPLKELR